MPESENHIRLVESLIQWIAQLYFKGDETRILVDSSISNGKPPRIGGYVPDAYAQFPGGDSFIIGEAKTYRDLESRHTRDQIVAFMESCRLCSGSVFVLAVPWYATRLAGTLLRVLKARYNCGDVRTIVIDKLPG